MLTAVSRLGRGSSSSVLEAEEVRSSSRSRSPKKVGEHAGAKGKTTSPAIEQAKLEALEKLRKLQSVEPKEARAKEWRALLRDWHPDKNPDNIEVAKEVFHAPLPEEICNRELHERRSWTGVLRRSLGFVGRPRSLDLRRWQVAAKSLNIPWLFYFTLPHKVHGLLRPLLKACSRSPAPTPPARTRLARHNPLVASAARDATCLGEAGGKLSIMALVARSSQLTRSCAELDRTRRKTRFRSASAKARVASERRDCG
eukprot:s1297_g16.t1